MRQVVEIGSYNVNGNCKEFISNEKKIAYVGIDVREGPDVDSIHDVTSISSMIELRLKYRYVDLMICMNVLEHIFNPIKALDNMIDSIADFGKLVVISPVVWELHDYPKDYCRLNPDFYSRYALEKKIKIVDGTFLFSTRDSEEFFDDLKIYPKGEHTYINLVYSKEMP